MSLKQKWESERDRISTLLNTQSEELSQREITYYISRYNVILEFLRDLN